jgi:hypothetical protein
LLSRWQNTISIFQSWIPTPLIWMYCIVESGLKLPESYGRWTPDFGSLFSCKPSCRFSVLFIGSVLIWKFREYVFGANPQYSYQLIKIRWWQTNKK